MKKQPPILRIFFILLLVFVAWKSIGSDEEESKVALQSSSSDIEQTAVSSSAKLEKPMDSVLAQAPAPVDSISKEENIVPLFDSSSFYKRQEDSTLASKLMNLLETRKPDGGFLLLLNPHTNKILAWAQRSEGKIDTSPTFLNQSTFPAASLIKIISAAAALESKQYSNHTAIPQIGRNHTLYKRQLRVPKNYSGPTVTLEEAFAKSINPAFGILGQKLGGDYLKETGKKFGFETQFKNDIPNLSTFAPPDTGYNLAEASCGFTASNTISPMLAAAIGRSILLGKELELPYSEKLAPEYSQKSDIEFDKLSDNTYYGLKKIFLSTSKIGTTRKSVRRVVYNYNRKSYRIGGKTGSLDGPSPKGRYDWYLGFAENKKDPKDAVVIVVMQYHQKLRSLRASDMAGLMLNIWEKNYSRPIRRAKEKKSIEKVALQNG